MKPNIDKKSGDLIQSTDWNSLMSAIEDLEISKIDSSGSISLQGPLNIVDALNIDGDLTVNGSTKITDSLSIVSDSLLEKDLEVLGLSFFREDIEIGTTESTAVLEVQGDVVVSGVISGGIDASHITSGTIDPERIPTSLLRADQEQQEWVNISHPYSSVHDPLRYCKDSCGIVHIEGQFYHEPIRHSFIFNLPKGYRPAISKVYLIPLSDLGKPNSGVRGALPDRCGIMTIFTNGKVYLYTEVTESHPFLNGVSFRAA